MTVFICVQSRNIPLLTNKGKTLGIDHGGKNTPSPLRTYRKTVIQMWRFIAIRRPYYALSNHCTHVDIVMLVTGDQRISWELRVEMSWDELRWVEMSWELRVESYRSTSYQLLSCQDQMLRFFVSLQLLYN